MDINTQIPAQLQQSDFPPAAYLVVDREYDDAILDHADRCWKAECENAERLTKERHLVLTILIAFLGFGLFKVEWLQAVIIKTNLPWPWNAAVGTTVMVLLAGAVVAFMGAIACLFHCPRRTTASVHLRIPGGAESDEMLTTNGQRRAAFSGTYAAYVSLMESNANLRERVSKAWRWFAVGIAIVAAVIVVYIVVKSVSLLLPAEATGGPGTETYRSVQVR